MANAVNNTTSTNPLAALQNRAPAAADADSADRFLTLLVTQMKNQDPPASPRSWMRARRCRPPRWSATTCW